MGVQSGNTLHALDCLVNEAGEVPAVSKLTANASFEYFLRTQPEVASNRIAVLISGISRDLHLDTAWLGYLLRYYGIGAEYLVRSKR
ncbi:hypothetical protein RSAG8_08097, partial [Rhizoctonia solani AG-8 WAC10335]